MLALTHATGPSLLQVRRQNVLPEDMGLLVIAALCQHDATLAAGALVGVDGKKSRVRVLPPNKLRNQAVHLTKSNEGLGSKSTLRTTKLKSSITSSAPSGAMNRSFSCSSNHRRVTLSSYNLCIYCLSAFDQPRSPSSRAYLMKTLTVNISFQAKILNEIDLIASEESRSRSELIRAATRLYIERKRRWRDIFEFGDDQGKRLRLTQPDVSEAIQAYSESR